MITPWEIYWVLQLDSIGSAFSGAAVISAAGIIVTAFFWAVSSDEDIGSAKIAETCRRITLFVLPPIFAVTFIASAFLPSTKTAAAMIVVPQIVNSPTVQHEAGDLYNLAKEALRDAIAPQHKDK